MALKIVWTKNAVEHIEEILQYWETRNNSTTYSKKLYILFQKSLLVLSRFPASGNKTNHETIRKKTIKDYFIYYTYDKYNLNILGIVDMRRNPKFIRRFEI